MKILFISALVWSGIALIACPFIPRSRVGAIDVWLWCALIGFAYSLIRPNS